MFALGFFLSFLISMSVLIWFKTRTPKVPPALDPVAELVIELLRSPIGWQRTQHTLYHAETGVRMWISNRWYGFGFRVDGGEVGPGNLDSFKHSQVKVDDYSRRAIIQAVKTHIADGGGDNGQAAVALAQRMIAAADARAANVIPIRQPAR